MLQIKLNPLAAVGQYIGPKNLSTWHASQIAIEPRKANKSAEFIKYARHEWLRATNLGKMNFHENLCSLCTLDREGTKKQRLRNSSTKKKSVPNSNHEKTPCQVKVCNKNYLRTK